MAWKKISPRGSEWQAQRFILGSTFYPFTQRIFQSSPRLTNHRCRQKNYFRSFNHQNTKSSKHKIIKLEIIILSNYPFCKLFQNSSLSFLKQKFAFCNCNKSFSFNFTSLFNLLKLNLTILFIFRSTKKNVKHTVALVNLYNVCTKLESIGTRGTV